MLGACQHSGAGVGPSKDEFAAAVLASPVVAGAAQFSTGDVRALGCRAFDEDPSEFLCHFQAQEPTGVRRKRFAIVAVERDGWVLLSLD
jgi:hypothetical protein